MRTGLLRLTAVYSPLTRCSTVNQVACTSFLGGAAPGNRRPRPHRNNWTLQICM